MGKFIKSLIESGTMKVYQDFRTGSISDLATPTRTTSITATPVFSTAPYGKAVIMGATGRFTLSPVTDLTVPTGGFIIGARYDFTPFASAYGEITRFSMATSRCHIYWAPTGLIAYDGTNTNLTGLRNWKTWFVRVVPGSIPTFYIDGAPIILSLSAALNPSGVPTAVYTASFLDIPAYAVMIANASDIDNLDIARLHRELMAGPTVVSRSKKHFSIPYPSKTPTEYAAEDIDYATSGEISSGKIIDFTSGGRDATLAGNGYVDVNLDGPFSSASRMRDVAVISNDSLLFRTNTWSIHTWVKPEIALNATGIILGKEALPHYGGVITGTVGAVNKSYIISTRNAALTPKQPGGAAIVVLGRWDHVVYVQSVSGSDLRLQVYVNGISYIDQTYVGEGASIPAIGNVNIGRYQASSSANQLLASIAYISYKSDVATTLTEARNEYLLGARKCLLDARVHSDGSCPVSLTTVGANNEIANGWKVEGGTWKVVEDAPSDGVAGDRWLKSQAAATISIKCDEQAYGSWYHKIRFNGVEHEYLFVATNETSVSSTAQNGYGIHVSAAGAVTLRERSSGTPSTLLTPGITLASGQIYNFWITRRFNGAFGGWIKGGAYTDWTTFGTITDTTTTSGGFQVQYAAGANVESAGIISFLGEINITEAIKLGLVEA